MASRRRGQAVVVGLAAFCMLELALFFAPISHHALWPVRMVARELFPLLFVVSLVGTSLAWYRRRVTLPIFVAGLAVGLWSTANVFTANREIQAQWMQQRHLASVPLLPSPFEVAGLTRAAYSVPDIAPTVISPLIHLYRRGGTFAEMRPLPVIVDIHGGSWQVGGVREDATFAKRMAALGYAVFAIDYRKAPRHPFPAQIEDVRTAIAWVRENGARYGADAKRIALVGRSAGGQLAMLAAYEHGAPPIRAVVSIYGPGDLRALYENPPSPDPLQVRKMLGDFLSGPPASQAEGYRVASPSTYIRAALPPTLHIQGGNDRVIPSQLTRHLHEQMLATGASSLMLELPWADHSFDFVYFGPGNRIAQRVIESFLEDTMR